MDFNIKRFCELIQESTKLSDEGKSLRDCDQEKYRELRNYAILIENAIFYQDITHYFEIVTFFLNNKISIYKFILLFKQERSNNLRTYLDLKKNLKPTMNLELNP